MHYKLLFPCLVLSQSLGTADKVLHRLDVSVTDEKVLKKSTCTFETAQIAPS